MWGHGRPRTCSESPPHASSRPRLERQRRLATPTRRRVPQRATCGAGIAPGGVGKGRSPTSGPRSAPPPAATGHAVHPACPVEHDSSFGLHGTSWSLVNSGAMGPRWLTRWLSGARLRSFLADAPPLLYSSCPIKVFRFQRTAQKDQRRSGRGPTGPCQLVNVLKSVTKKKSTRVLAQSRFWSLFGESQKKSC
jgi:hypothetical protein